MFYIYFITNKIEQKCAGAVHNRAPAGPETAEDPLAPEATDDIGDHRQDQQHKEEPPLAGWNSSFQFIS